MKTVVLLGPEGSFSHLAGSRLKLKVVSVKSFPEIFQNVMKGKADYGLVPVKNTLSGPIRETAKFLKKWKKFLKVEKKIQHGIELHLASARKMVLGTIKKLYVPPYVIRQCEKFLKKRLPKAALKKIASTSAALQKAAKEKGAAAIGSLQGIEQYGLKLLAKNIHDQKKNFTTFLLFSKRPDRTKPSRGGKARGRSRKKR